MASMHDVIPEEKPKTAPPSEPETAPAPPSPESQSEEPETIKAHEADDDATSETSEAALEDIGAKTPEGLMFFRHSRSMNEAT